MTGAGNAATLAALERDGFRLQLKARAVVLGVIAAWLLVTVPLERSLIYATLCGVFGLLGWAVDILVVRGIVRRWRALAVILIAVDLAVLSAAMVVPNPFQDQPWPPQVTLRFPNFLYVLLYVIGSSLTTSPALVLWTGAAASAAWSVCFWWMVSTPGTLTFGGLRLIDTPLSAADQIAIYLDPRFVSGVSFQTQVLVALVGSGILALAVARARGVLLQRVRAEAERTSLARFVAPDLADDLAAGPALGDISQRPVAVLFADIVGFSGMAERLAPEQAVALLRGFHGRMARVAMRHGGTLDKFIGDAVMVTFGARETRPDDAARALGCALGMVAEAESWNAKRRDRGAETVGIGVGLHHGRAVAGTVGAEERLEYTVIGDVVNVANRLERATRELGVPLVASDAAVEAARRAGADEGLLASFESGGDLPIRGRREALSIWTARSVDRRRRDRADPVAKTQVEAGRP